MVRVHSRPLLYFTTSEKVLEVYTPGSASMFSPV